MAYSSDENAGGLDILTALATGDLHIVGDISDSNRAKVISQNNLENTFVASTNFLDALIASNYFTQNLAGDSDFQAALAGDSDFITLLTSDTLFQTLVNNFAGGGGGGGGGGTKLAIDTTQSSFGGGVPGTAYTVNIPGGTLGTNNAIRFKVLLSSVVTSGASLGIKVSYGGTLLGQMSITDQDADGGIVFGEIIADGATNAQKFIGSSLTLIDGTGAIVSDTKYDDASAVDSTIDQDLVIEINPSGATTVNTEAIIVEKIDSGFSGASLGLTAPMGVSPVEWDSENFDDGGYHDNVTDPERITIPLDGKYLIMATVAGTASGGGEPAFINITKNGTDVLLESGGYMAQPGGWTDGGFSVSGIFEFVAGDYLEVIYNQRTNGPWSVPVAGTNFSITKLA